ncbi:MAG: DNA polymerase III subunit epsilon [Helicobacteraceae bacterium 4484_230]|nr:MAG: DNA polymerase III subunit epsilon [Helicobacteraceae bacterium 4484_230]
MKIVILDTETTGVLEEDRIIQLSYMVLGQNGDIEEVHNVLCSAPLPIKYDSMAIHHITPEMTEGKPSCVDTEAFARLNELNKPENLLVIQNAVFDLDMLKKEGFESNMQLIDTFRVLRALYPYDTPHGLQYKRYQLGLYKKEQEIIDRLGIEVKAHDALGDVIVLKNLFDHLSGEQDMEAMIKLCRGPILLEIMTFGKHKGKKFEDLAVTDRNSLQYMLENFDLDEDLRFTMKHYLDKAKANSKIMIGFGKYKGRTPDDIAKEDPDYLKWMRDKAERIDADLKEEIIKVLKDIP